MSLNAGGLVSRSVSIAPDELAIFRGVAIPLASSITSEAYPGTAMTQVLIC